MAICVRRDTQSKFSDVGFHNVLIDLYKLALVKYNSKAKAFFNLPFKSNLIGRNDVEKHPKLSHDISKIPSPSSFSFGCHLMERASARKEAFERGKK